MYIDESELAMWRKQTMEKDKEIAKASKPICSKPICSPKKTKRQCVRSVPYSPPLYTKKKTTSNKRQKIKNKNVST